MSGMPTSIGWGEISFRLAVTIVAGLALGFDRSEHGKSAGLRTTLLVCLAASASMIEVNLLLPTAGRTSDLFVMNDLMRFPLGILTGVGFIGGGAILRRGSLVVGLTTAATLWLATMVGLSVGAGEIGLGMATTAIGLAALGPVGWIEARLPRQRTVMLAVELHDSGLTEQELRRRLTEAGFKLASSRGMVSSADGRSRYVFELRFTAPISETAPPPFLQVLATAPEIAKIEWRIQS